MPARAASVAQASTKRVLGRQTASRASRAPTAPLLAKARPVLASAAVRILTLATAPAHARTVRRVKRLSQGQAPVQPQDVMLGTTLTALVARRVRRVSTRRRRIILERHARNAAVATMQQRQDLQVVHHAPRERGNEYKSFILEPNEIY